jgi:hypothetical protein
MLESLKGAEGTLRRSGGELDPIRKAAAGMAGHLRAIPDRPKINAVNLPKTGTGKRAQAFFTEMTGPDMVHPEDYRFQKRKVGGAHLPGQKLIKHSAEAGVLEHEWVHALEFLNPQLAARALAFREARTKGLPLVPLPVANKDAIGKEDEFIHPYIGRFYVSNATEVTTSAVELMVAGERFWGTLKVLLHEDPELFFFALGQLAGR